MKCLTAGGMQIKATTLENSLLMSTKDEHMLGPKLLHYKIYTHQAYIYLITKDTANTYTSSVTLTPSWEGPNVWKV